MTALVPFNEIHQMAESISASKLFGVKSIAEAIALMLVAQANGMHPAAAARDYDVVAGRPAKKAEAMLRDFISAGGTVKWHSLTNEIADATFSHHGGGSVRIDWTMERAKLAGLGGKDMWRKFPRQMLRSRCVSEGVRTVYPGATSGLYVEEEVEDMPPPQEKAVDVSEYVEIESPLKGDRYAELEQAFGTAADMETVASVWMSLTKEERKAVTRLKDKAKERLTAEEVAE
jgi:hypothetical protein